MLLISHILSYGSWLGIVGHVASLFPTRQQHYKKKQCVTLTIDASRPPPSRITFRLRVINSISEITLVIIGVEQAGTVTISWVVDLLQVQLTYLLWKFQLENWHGSWTSMLIWNFNYAHFKLSWITRVLVCVDLLKNGSNFTCPSFSYQ